MRTWSVSSFDSSLIYSLFVFFKEVAHCLVLPQVKKEKGGAPPKDIKWRIYSHHIFEWRATNPYKVSFGTVRFCFLCLALLVFSPCCYRVPTISLSFIFIGI